jgi:hypothetical protein
MRSNDSNSFSSNVFNFYSLDSKVDNLTPQAQGILGLQYSNSYDTSNFICSVLPEKQRIFGMYLNNNNYSISMGGIDETLIA